MGVPLDQNGRLSSNFTAWRVGFEHAHAEPTSESEQTASSQQTTITTSISELHNVSLSTSERGKLWLSVQAPNLVLQVDAVKLLANTEGKRPLHKRSIFKTVWMPNVALWPNGNKDTL